MSSVTISTLSLGPDQVEVWEVRKVDWSLDVWCLESGLGWVVDYEYLFQ